MYYQNNKPLPTGRAFTLGDVQYPANWLQLSSAEDRAVLGITWVADPVRADDRFYWNGDANMPKAMDDVNEVDQDNNPLLDADGNQVVTKGLKSQWTAQVKDTAGKMLAATDWMVIRKAERGVDIPADVATKRAAIIAEADRLEAAIAGASDIDAFIAVVSNQNWGNE